MAVTQPSSIHTMNDAVYHSLTLIRPEMNAAPIVCNSQPPAICHRSKNASNCAENPPGFSSADVTTQNTYLSGKINHDLSHNPNTPNASQRSGVTSGSVRSSVSETVANSSLNEDIYFSLNVDSIRDEIMRDLAYNAGKNLHTEIDENGISTQVINFASDTVASDLSNGYENPSLPDPGGQSFQRFLRTYSHEQPYQTLTLDRLQRPSHVYRSRSTNSETQKDKLDLDLLDLNLELHEYFLLNPQGNKHIEVHKVPVCKEDSSITKDDPLSPNTRRAREVTCAVGTQPKVVTGAPEMHNRMNAEQLDSMDCVGGEVDLK